MDLISEHSEPHSDSVYDNDYLLASNKLARHAAITTKRMDASRLLCVQQWFLKCSNIEQVDYMYQLGTKLDNLENLQKVLTPLKLYFGKYYMLTEAMQTTNFIDDKYLHDVNRNMDSKILTETQITDQFWFVNLEQDDQASIMIALCKLMGIGSSRKLYLRLHKLYTNRMKEVFNELEAQTNERKDVQERKYDPEHPLTVLVTEKRKEWDDIMKKYREDVYRVKTTEKISPQIEKKQKSKSKLEKGKKAKSGKSNKSGKSGKSSKSSKSGKSGKTKGKNKKPAKPKKGKAEKQYLDIIQLLPVWLIRKIFSYLDQTTLNIVKDVNTHWNYTITEIFKEQATRHNINKLICKMEEKVDMNFVDLSQNFTKDNDVILSRTDKRLLKQFQKGTLLKNNLQYKGDMAEFSLLHNTLKDAPEDTYILPTYNLKPFPRYVPKNPNEPLLKTPSSMVIEHFGLYKKRPITELTTDGITLFRKMDANETQQSFESLSGLAEPNDRLIAPPNIRDSLITCTTLKSEERSIYVIDSLTQYEKTVSATKPDVASLLQQFTERFSNIVAKQLSSPSVQQLQDRADHGDEIDSSQDASIPSDQEFKHNLIKDKNTNSADNYQDINNELSVPEDTVNYNTYNADIYSYNFDDAAFKT